MGKPGFYQPACILKKKNFTARSILTVVWLLSLIGMPVPRSATAVSSITAGSTPARAARLSPALRLRLAAQTGSDLIPVIVTLHSSIEPQQAALTGPERTRQEQVICSLRLQAETAQKILDPFLKDPRFAGKIQKVRQYWVINAVALNATPDIIQTLAARQDVERVDLVQTFQAPNLIPATAVSWDNLGKINAPDLWNLGARGQGIVVANLDTGVDYSHPELSANWRGGSNSWYDPYGKYATPSDLPPTSRCAAIGHGTATMSVMVGQTTGVAPGAKWIAAKVFNDGCTADTNAILSAFQWILDPDGNPATADAPQVVNSSWGAKTCDASLVFQDALIALRAAGILPVFSAGNDGPTASTISYPGNYPEAFPVGATDSQDAIAYFSSRGPNLCVQPAAISPAISAPGVSINVALPNVQYGLEDGTSFAAPHVAGSLALLLSAFPDLSLNEQVQALQSSAMPLGGTIPNNTSGYGRLDVSAAFHAVLFSRLNFSSTSAAVNEGDGAIPLTLQLSSPAAVPLTISFAQSGGNGTVDGSDYLLPGPVTFSAWETQKSIQVGILDNTLPEADKTVRIRMVLPDGYLPGDSSKDLSITIQDNDPQVGFSASQFVTSESAGNTTITVRRSGGLNIPVSIDYATSDGTARSGVNYQPVTQTLTFAPGVTQQSFPIHILPDLTPSEDKTVLLTLSNPQGAVLSPAATQSTLIISNTDLWKTFLPILHK